MIIKAPQAAQLQLSHFWAQYFAEIPVCTCEACGEVAIEVDPFFPYLDDRNRCTSHRLEDSYEASGSLS